MPKKTAFANCGEDASAESPAERPLPVPLDDAAASSSAADLRTPITSKEGEADVDRQLRFDEAPPVQVAAGTESGSEIASCGGDSSPVADGAATSDRLSPVGRDMVEQALAEYAVASGTEPNDGVDVSSSAGPTDAEDAAPEAAASHTATAQIRTGLLPAEGNGLADEVLAGTREFGPFLSVMALDAYLQGLPGFTCADVTEAGSRLGFSRREEDLLKETWKGLACLVEMEELVVGEDAKPVLRKADKGDGQVFLEFASDFQERLAARCMAVEVAHLHTFRVPPIEEFMRDSRLHRLLELLEEGWPQFQVPFYHSLRGRGAFLADGTLHVPQVPDEETATRWGMVIGRCSEIGITFGLKLDHESGLKSLLAHASKLVRLDISGIQLSVGGDLEDVLRVLGRSGEMESLRMRFVAKFADADLGRLVTLLPPALSSCHLLFAHNTTFTDAGLSLLAAGLPQQITDLILDFGDNANFTDEALCTLGKALPPGLQTFQLSMAKSKHFTNNGYRALANGLPTTLQSMGLFLGFEGCFSFQEFTDVKDFRYRQLKQTLVDPNNNAHHIWQQPLYQQ